MGIGQKVKDVAHKMGVGTGSHAEEERGTTFGSSYENVGATYGAAGTSGVAAPVAPGVATTQSDIAAAEPLRGEGAYGVGTGTNAYGTAGTGVAGASGVERGAYGTEGMAYGGEGVETRTGIAEVPVVQQTTTTTTVDERLGAEGVPAGRGAACGAEYFTKVEDRPVVKEVVQQVMEHRPVEQEFVVETRATGAEREVGGREVEHLGTTERVVAAAPPRPVPE